LPAGADRIGQPAHDRERRALSRERERERRRPSRRERSRERDLSLRANRRASLKHADGNNQRKEQPKTNHQPATLAARRSDVVDPTSGAQRRHARRLPIRTSRPLRIRRAAHACTRTSERVVAPSIALPLAVTLAATAAAAAPARVQAARVRACVRAGGCTRRVAWRVRCAPRHRSSVRAARSNATVVDCNIVTYRPPSLPALDNHLRCVRHACARADLCFSSFSLSRERERERR
jgi:hypothetical protein